MCYFSCWEWFMLLFWQLLCCWYTLISTKLSHFHSLWKIKTLQWLSDCDRPASEAGDHSCPEAPAPQPCSSPSLVMSWASGLLLGTNHELHMVGTTPSSRHRLWLPAVDSEGFLLSHLLPQVICFNGNRLQKLLSRKTNFYHVLFPASPATTKFILVIYIYSQLLIVQGYDP